jgi:hypothetical protein
VTTRPSFQESRSWSSAKVYFFANAAGNPLVTFSGSRLVKIAVPE